MKVDPNASAFPTVTTEAPGDAPVGTYVTTGDKPGMSIRVWLAGQAMAAIGNFYTSNECAEKCVRMADALIAQLNK